MGRTGLIKTEGAKRRSEQVFAVARVMDHVTLCGGLKGRVLESTLSQALRSAKPSAQRRESFVSEATRRLMAHSFHVPILPSLVYLTTG